MLLPQISSQALNPPATALEQDPVASAKALIAIFLGAALGKMGVSAPDPDRPVSVQVQNFHSAPEESIVSRLEGAVGKIIEPFAHDPGKQIGYALVWLSDNVSLFEAAEKVAAPTSDPSNGWFANAGLFKMAELSQDSGEWAEIEQTLGRPVPPSARNQAIAVAKTLQQNWSTLFARAPSLGLETRTDELGAQVIDFKTDTLKLSSWETGTQIQGALGCLRDHVSLFEAAERVAVPTSDPSNGWFANAGLFKVAELSRDSGEWAEIEQTLGRPVPLSERDQAIAAAKVVQQNWSTLFDLAPRMGLEVRIDDYGRQVIDFKTGSLKAATNVFVYIGSAKNDSVDVQPFGEADRAEAGGISPSGDAYVVTVTSPLGKKQYLTQFQAEHMIFDLREGNDEINVGFVDKVPYGVFVLGGEGDDRIKGGGGDDYLDGGAGPGGHANSPTDGHLKLPHLS